jgi:hypothetical protein
MNAKLMNAARAMKTLKRSALVVLTCATRWRTPMSLSS